MVAPNDDPATVIPAEAESIPTARLELLTSLGVTSLSEIGRFVGDDDLSRLKFAAACVLLGESLSPDKLQNELSHEPAHLHPVHNLPEPKSNEETDPAALDESEDISASASTAPSSESDVLDGSQTKEVYKRHIDPVARKQRNIEWYSKRLLGYKVPPEQAQQFQDFVVSKILPMYRHMQQAQNYPTNYEDRIVDAELYLSGLGNAEISERTGINIGSLANSRPYAINKILSRYPQAYLQTQFAQYLEEYKSPDSQGDVMVADPSEGRVAAGAQEENIPPARPKLSEAPAEQLVGQPVVDRTADYGPEADITDDEWRAAMLDIVRPYWRAEDLGSLDALFSNKDGEETQAARWHLSRLLSVYANCRPGQGNNEMDVLSFVQWETFNLLTAYQVHQGQRPMASEMVARHMHSRYERKGTTFEQTAQQGLERLIKKASRDYGQGWYPEIQASAETVIAKPETPEPAAAAETEEPEPEDQLRSLLVKVLKSRGLSTRQLDLLTEHLNGSEASLTNPQLGIAAMALQRQLVKAANSRPTPRRGKPAIDERHVLSHRETQELGLLLGDFQHRQLRTLEQAAKEMSIRYPLNPKTPEELKLSIVQALRKLLHHK